jgi:thymidylate synthase
MRQYHALLSDVLTNGYRQENRTTSAALTLPYGTTLRFDMRDGFPAITTKRLHFAGIRGEIIGFLRGYTNAEHFAELGCSWWRKDANTNTEWLSSPYRKGPGDLGHVYGYLWRRWPRADGTYIDQVQAALDAIRTNPTSRRILFSAWNPDELEKMALPPCHVLYRFQVNVAAGELNMSMYQRSADMFLGVPMNIAGAALLLHLFAAATGLRPRWLTHHIDEPHIYENAIDAVREQLGNEHLAPPVLQIYPQLFGATADELAAVNPYDIRLIGYQCTDLKAPRVEMVTG